MKVKSELPEGTVKPVKFVRNITKPTPTTMEARRFMCNHNLTRRKQKCMPTL